MTNVQIFEAAPPGEAVPAESNARAVFEENLVLLAAQGIRIERYNLKEHLGAFADGSAKKALDREGESCLPLVLIDGRLASSGAYPELETLADLLELDMTAENTSLVTERTSELIALAAAAAVGSERAFQVHHDRAVGLGVVREDLIQAVNIGLTVKALPHQTVVDLAQRLLMGGEGCGCGSGCGCGANETAEESCGQGACGCN